MGFGLQKFRLSPSQLIVLLFLAWLIGLVRFLSSQFLVIGWLSWNVGLILYLWFRRHLLAVALLVIASFLLAQSYLNWYLKAITPSVSFGDQKLNLLFLTKPTKTDDQARYLGQYKNWQISLTVPRTTSIPLGQTVTVAGEVAPLSTTNPNYPLIAAKDRIFAELKRPQVLAVRPAHLTLSQRFLLWSRQRFDRTIEHFLNQPQAALFAGIVAGLKSDLPTEILADFKIAGLTHLIAVSGFNVTIMVSLFTRFTRSLGRFVHLFVSLSIIFAFVIFTGATASVVRAGIMASLLIFNRTLGRRASLIRILLLTAVIMSLNNPLVVGYDFGFQLSFGALLGLILFATSFEERLVRLHLPALLAEILAPTLAAELMTVPLLAANFGLVATYSLLANLLVEPLITPLTAAGLPLIVIGSFLPLPVAIGWPFDLALRYILVVVSTISHLPGASLHLPSLPAFIWVDYYILIAGLYYGLAPPHSARQNAKL